MILGMSLAAFTQLHVVISLIAIVAGFMVIFSMIASKDFPILNALFLALTALTSLTGFFFPFKGITPGIVIGILSIVVLIVAAVARYRGHLTGKYRSTYVITSVIALFFNFFVLIVQSFQKIPSLHALAPTQSEAPFKIAQIVTLLVFLILGTLAFRRFRITPA